MSDCLDTLDRLNFWKAKDRNEVKTNEGAWMFNVKNVQTNWTIPTKEDWSNTEHIVDYAKCPKCGMEAKSKGGITKKFGGFTPMRPPKFIQSQCKSCRRG